MDKNFLDILRNIRNKAAHASGHKPSAEEARYIFYEVINRFLCQPILSTAQLIDELIQRLENNNFSPTTIKEDVKEVVAEEINSLHKQAFPMLISKLIEKTNSSSSNINIGRNATLFITGLASLDKADLNKLLQKK